MADIGCSLLQFGYCGQHRRNWSLCVSLSITVNSVKLERQKLAAEQSFCYTGQPWSVRLASVRGQELRGCSICPNFTSGFTAPTGTASPTLFLGGKAKSCHSSKPLASRKIPEYRDVLSTPCVGRVYIQKAWPTVSDAMLYGNRTTMVQVGTQ